MRHFFLNTIIAVFQLKHLKSKTPGLEIFKMWSTIFVSSKLTEILRNLYKGIESFASNPNFLKPVSLQPDDVNLRYFKLKLFYPSV